MATNYEENTVGFGTPQPSIASIVDDLRSIIEIPLNEEYLTELRQKLRLHLVTLETIIQSDFLVPRDFFTHCWLRKYYMCYQKVVRDGIDLQQVIDAFDVVLSLCETHHRCDWYNDPPTDDSDSDDDYHSTSSYAAAILREMSLNDVTANPPQIWYPPDDFDYEYEDPPEDLTEEGIEPNPGPAQWKDPPPRYNRYRGDATPTRRERRAFKTELRLHTRLVTNSYNNRIKFSTLDMKDRKSVV